MQNAVSKLIFRPIHNKSVSFLLLITFSSYKISSFSISFRDMTVSPSSNRINVSGKTRILYVATRIDLPEENKKFAFLFLRRKDII